MCVVTDKHLLYSVCLFCLFSISVSPTEIQIEDAINKSYYFNDTIYIRIQDRVRLNCIIPTPSLPSGSIVWSANNISAHLGNQVDYRSAPNSLLLTSSRSIVLLPSPEDDGKSVTCFVTHVGLFGSLSATIFLRVGGNTHSVR